MINTELAALRREYSNSELSKTLVLPDPFLQFAAWINDVLRAEIAEASAMTLSTASAVGEPSSRVVLLKGFDENGFVFFTNYESRKGLDLESNPNAVLHFFWPQLERQINITGTAARISATESDEYFASRPFESRIGAWASHQSQILVSRSELEERVADLLIKYADGHVPRPPYWGGYRIQPARFEFWQGRESRLHDRICYTRKDDGWEITRLSP